jgi:hypothetical protein
MEQDVSVIVDVDPEEADLLVWLVETLLRDWYVGSHERDKRMGALIAAAGKKSTAASKSVEPRSTEPDAAPPPKKS